MTKINSKGSIQALEKKPKSKCRKWLLRVRTGKRNLKTGNYEQIGRRFTGTYREAQAALRELANDVESNAKAKNTRIEFCDYAKVWLEKRQDQVAYGTWKKDKDRTKILLRHLNHARLDDITPEVVENTYNAIMNGGIPSGKKPSGTYANGIAVTLKTIMKSAVDDEVILSNPCDKVHPPSTDTQEKKALSFKQMTELISKLDPTNASQFAILLSLKTGIRRGEACGLSWGDIDLQNKTLSIVHSYDDGGHLKEPKTKAAMRTIPINDSVASDLRVRRCYLYNKFIRAREKAGIGGPIINPEMPVICDTSGKRQLPHSVTRWWDRHRDSLGCSKWTVHEMRHSFLSEMARRDVGVKVLQTIAGHAKYATTMDIYTHVSMEDKKDAMEAIQW